MWEKWKELMKSSEKFLGSLPIVPLPGGWAIGINKVSEIWLSKRLDNITNSMDEKSRDILQKRFPWAYWWITNSSESDKTSQEVNAILNEVKTENKQFNDLKPEQKELITKYYWWNEAIATSIVNNIYNYTNNVEGVQTKIQNEITEGIKSWSHTSADALKLTDAQLDIAVQNDPTWKAWAAWVIWGAVHTSSWVRIVDVVKWTELTGNPVYRIVKREDYEENHFWKAMPTVQQADFDNWKKQQDVNSKDLQEYLGKLETKYNELSELQKKPTKTEDEENVIKQLKDQLFTEDFIKRLQELDPNKFKWEWQ